MKSPVLTAVSLLSTAVPKWGSSFRSSTEVEDLFSFNLVILPRTYWFAAIFALVMLLISQLPAIRQVTRLSLATATKEWSE